MDHRCLATAQITPDQWKRCIRDELHPEQHVWVEALNRVDGPPHLVTWDTQREPSPRICEILV